MHRSYNSYNPVASKILQKRWDEKHFDDHRKHVSIHVSIMLSECFRLIFIYFNQNKGLQSQTRNRLITSSHFYAFTFEIKKATSKLDTLNRSC